MDNASPPCEFDTGARPLVYQMRTLQTGSKSCRVKDEHGCFPVADLALLNQLQRMRQRYRFERHEFVSLAAALAPREAGCHEAVDALVDETRRRVEGV